MSETMNFSEGCGLNLETQVSGRVGLVVAGGVAYDPAISTGSTVSLAYSAAKTNIASLFFVSDSADCDVTFVASASSNNTALHLSAGEPAEFKAGGSYFGANNQTKNPLTADFNSITINNNGTQAVATAVHVRIGTVS